MQAHSYVLKWRHGVSPEIQWFLRGISDDGSFYGELRSVWESPRIIDGQPAKGIGKVIEGKLSPADSRRFNELVADVGRPGAEPIDGWTGLLADGPVDAPRIRFYYLPQAEKESSEASRFLAAVDLLGGYIRPYYSDVASPAYSPQADQ